MLGVFEGETEVGIVGKAVGKKVVGVAVEGASVGEEVGSEVGRVGVEVGATVIGAIVLGSLEGRSVGLSEGIYVYPLTVGVLVGVELGA